MQNYNFIELEPSTKAVGYLRNIGLHLNLILDKESVDVSSWWANSTEGTWSVRKYKGSITFEGFDDEVPIEVGNFKCRYFPFFDPLGDTLEYVLIADAIEGGVYSAAEVVSKIDREEEMYLGAGMLYIDSLYIKPQYRGHQLGYLILPVLIDTCSPRKNSIIAIIPSPSYGTNDKMKSDEESVIAKKKMEKFLTDFGFVEKENDVWVALSIDEYDGY